jgi:hypothetical protein
MKSMSTKLVLNPFEEINSQEYEGLQISKGRRYCPRNVVLVQVQAY